MVFLFLYVCVNMGFGICGFVNIVDLLFVIKYVIVKLICDEDGYIYDYEIVGDFLCYGEDDDCVDLIVEWLFEVFYGCFVKYKFYKDVEVIVFFFIIILNVVYFK